MKLWRAHGLGNDYLVLEEGPTMTPDSAVAICHRHTGVGSDGVLEPFDTQDADYGVRIWNPDGSIAEKSGNGLRIFARWLVEERGACNDFTVHTGHDRVRCEVLVGSIRVAMGPAVVSEALVLEGRMVVPVNVGNPHCVIFGDFPDDWRSIGSRMEVNSQFPNRTNVQFAQVMDRNNLDIRIWERGAGETSASGSSSCAAAAAGVQTGRLDSGDITVHMPGGQLHVRVDPDMGVHLTGPVQVVGRITVDSRWPGC